MFPVGDVIPSRTTPWVTLTILALVALAFAWELHLEDNELQLALARYGGLPAVFDWRPVLPGMFLHAGWLHAAANLLYVWLFGPALEDRFGRLPFALFYVSGGVAAALAYAALGTHAGRPVIGASGAVGAVLGAYVVLYPQSRVLTAVFAVVILDVVELPAIFYMGFWFLAQLFSDVGSIRMDAPGGSTTLTPHLCAFVAGGVIGGFVRFRERRVRTYWRTELVRRRGA